MPLDSSLATLAATWPRPSTSDPAGQRLIVLGGLPAAGKSTFARRLAAQAAAVHISADAVRMALSANQPVYSLLESRRTRKAVAALTEMFLAAGYTVVIDAINIRRRDRRNAFALGRRGKVPTLLIWCEVDEETATARLTRRAEGLDPADYSRANEVDRARLAALVEAPRGREAQAALFLRPEQHEHVLATSCSFGLISTVPTAATV